MSVSGKLCALISTPATVALLYNKEYFEQHAERVARGGPGPGGAPRTLQELDRYAEAWTMSTKRPDGSSDIKSMGYMPLEPGWWIQFTGLWFGNDDYDETDRYHPAQ